MKPAVYIHKHVVGEQEIELRMKLWEDEDSSGAEVFIDTTVTTYFPVGDLDSADVIRLARPYLETTHHFTAKVGTWVSSSNTVQTIDAKEYSLPLWRAPFYLHNLTLEYVTTGYEMLTNCYKCNVYSVRKELSND